MLDGSQVDDLCMMLSDRYSPEELIEVLGVTTQDVFERFMEECIEIDWSKVIE
jgi:hypothetical protein